MYNILLPLQTSIPPIISSNTQIYEKLQVVRHLRAIAHASLLLDQSTKTKQLPTDEEGDEEELAKKDDMKRQGSIHLDLDLTATEEKQSQDTIDNNTTKATYKEQRIAIVSNLLQRKKIEITPLPQSDPDYSAILTYITNTNYKCSFQVMDMYSVSIPHDEEEEEGKDKGERKLLWSGGLSSGVLDLLVNGWRCDDGGKEKRKHKYLKYRNLM